MFKWFLLHTYIDGLENNNKPFHPKGDRFGSSVTNSDFFRAVY